MTMLNCRSILTSLEVVGILYVPQIYTFQNASDFKVAKNMNRLPRFPKSWPVELDWRDEFQYKKHLLCTQCSSSGFSFSSVIISNNIKYTSTIDNKIHFGHLLDLEQGFSLLTIMCILVFTFQL